MPLTGAGAAWAVPAPNWTALARITVAESAAPTVSFRFTYGFLPGINRVCAVAPHSGAPGVSASGAERMLTCCRAARAADDIRPDVGGAAGAVTGLARSMTMHMMK
ncbi:hypothetical protein GCM10009664_35860 [Kitasatospora gansuensis]